MIKVLTYGRESVKAIVKDATEHQQKNWVNGNFYETQRHGLLNHIFLHHRGQTFLDVGASIGNHTLFFAGICKSPFVVAIEPFAESFAHLWENLQLNDLTEDVVCIMAAVGDHSGEVGIAPYGKGGNVGMVQVDPLSTEKVPYITLDETFQDSAPFDVIKIDVEHHNKEVLTGMDNILTRWNSTIYIEAESKEQFNEVANILKPYGYKYTGDVFNHTPTYKFKK